MNVCLKSLNAGLVREAQRRMKRHGPQAHMAFLDPNSWPSPNSPEWDTFGEASVLALAECWDGFLTQEQLWCFMMTQNLCFPF
jgi:hypothetical protein